MNRNLNISTFKSREGKTMRSLFALFIATLFLASCSSTYETSAPYDEVYAVGEPGTKVYKQERVTVSSDPVTESSQYEGDYYSSEYSSEDFDSEGYYDYEYASRIKRFGETSQGFDYYDGYYTDSYQYSGNPNHYGTTIYNGCGAGCYTPCYSCSRPSVSLSFGLGWGWASSYWGYPYGYGWYDPWYRPWYWYRPYYSYYSPYRWGGYYSPYYGGSYWHGYWDGYYAGGGGYYPGEDYGSNRYYGPRTSVGRSSDGSGFASQRGFRDPGTQNTGSSSKDAAISRAQRSEIGSGEARKGNEATATRQRPVETRSANTRTAERQAAIGEAGATRDAGSTQATRKVDVTRERPSTASRTYEKPSASRSDVRTSQRQENVSSSATRRIDLPEQKYNKPKSYTSPKVRTTPSSREYTSPSSKNTRGFSSETRKTYVATPERKRVTSSERSSSRSSSFSFPSSSQSRSYSTPSRSNTRSYSAPSRSNTRS